MYNAPPVDFPVGRFAWGWVWGGGAVVLSAIGLLAWQWLTQADAMWVACMWGGWLMCLLGAAWWAPRQLWASGFLVWSGEAWFWQAEPGQSGPLQPVSLSVGLDAGHGMLLWVRRLDAKAMRFNPWASAWLQQDAMPTKWHGFRCAVYSRPMGDRTADRLVTDPL